MSLTIKQFQRELRALPTEYNVPSLQTLDTELFTGPGKTYVANEDYLSARMIHAKAERTFVVISIIAIASCIIPPLGAFFFFVWQHFDEKLSEAHAGLKQAEQAFLQKLRPESEIVKQVQKDLERNYSIQFRGKIYKDTSEFLRALDQLNLPPISRRLLLENCHQGLQSLCRLQAIQQIGPMMQQVNTEIHPDIIDDVPFERIIAVHVNSDLEPTLETSNVCEFGVPNEYRHGCIKTVYEIPYTIKIKPLSGRVSISHGSVKSFSDKEIPFFRTTDKVLLTITDRIKEKQRAVEGLSQKEAINLVQKDLIQLMTEGELSADTYDKYMLLLAYADLSIRQGNLPDPSEKNPKVMIYYQQAQRLEDIISQTKALQRINPELTEEKALEQVKRNFTPIYKDFIEQRSGFIAGLARQARRDDLTGFFALPLPV